MHAVNTTQVDMLARGLPYRPQKPRSAVTTHHKVQVALDVGCLVLAMLQVDLSHGHTRTLVVGAGLWHTLETLQGPCHIACCNGSLAVSHHDGHFLTRALKLMYGLLQQLSVATGQTKRHFFQVHSRCDFGRQSICRHEMHNT